MNMKYYAAIFFVIFLMVCFSTVIRAQNIYELRKLDQNEWLEMSTEERLNALSIANRHAENQTFLGDFGRYYDQYKRWGYDFYEMNDRYENYTFRNFENYNKISEKRRRWSFNEFGDRIPRMRHSANVWSEVYSGDNTFYIQPTTNYINSMTSNSVDGVWIGSESTEDWAISVIGAGAIRKKFTPLSLNLPNIDGMAIEFQSANTSLSLVNSSLLHMYNVFGRGIKDPTMSDLVQRGGVLLRGGYIRRKFGALTIGATHVNQYSVQGNREKGDSWYGTLSDFTPTPIYVALRIMDDSPESDKEGATVYNVSLKVNGRNRPDIQPLIYIDDVTLDRVTAVTHSMYQYYITPTNEAIVNKPDLDLLSNENVPKYLDYILDYDLTKGNNLKFLGKDYDINHAKSSYHRIVQGIKPIQINGTETAVYLFDITSIKENINRVEAVIKVANDYRIQTSQIFTRESKGGHDTSGNMSWYKSTYWTTMAQAEGNVKDNSNITTINLDFGYQVATIMYGLDTEFNYRGFKILGEYVVNSNHYMYPDGFAGTGNPTTIIHAQSPRSGHKWSVNDNAYYIIAQKDWRGIGFSGELFKLGKFYRPYLDYYNTLLNDRLYSSQGALAPRNRCVRLPLIEDNDDNDMNPDTDYVRRAMGYRIWSFQDPDGVFPGNDENNDGISDNNKNVNMIPDYDEPFLMFDSNPDEFVFGNDYNNNSIPDYREDDMKLDTPYELDRQGYHYYLRFTPIKYLNLFGGSLQTKGVGSSNITNDNYFKAQIKYNVSNVGKIFAEYRYDRIQDNIQDPYVRVETTQKSSWTDIGTGSTMERYNRSLYYDLLEYKNSKVTKLFIASKIRSVPSITLENNIKFESNEQIKGTMYDKSYQNWDRINTLAMVNKLVYTKRFGDFIFSPGVNYKLYKKACSETIRLYDHYLMCIPLVMFKYIVSPRSSITLGLQGIPGFEFYFKDYAQSENDYKRNTYLFQIENRTTYFGYDIWASTGFKIDEIDYSEQIRKFENIKSTNLFVRIVLGY